MERCLADSLILLAEQQVGDEKLWLLPQTEWQEGETLRQTAERALASLPGNPGVLAIYSLYSSDYVVDFECVCIFLQFHI